MIFKRLHNWFAFIGIIQKSKLYQQLVSFWYSLKRILKRVFSIFIKPIGIEPFWRKWTRRFLKASIYGFLFIIIYFGALQINFLWLFGKMPSVYSLEHPTTSVASEVYSSDGVLLGKYFRENRSPVAYKEISEHIINALIATEDVRFYEHNGIDLKAAFSAFWYNATGHNRGASTITQQLAKNLFKTRENNSKGLLGTIPFVKTIVAKSKEWLVAIRLEKHYSKNKILTMYLNTVDFGSNSFGIKVASKTYFSKQPNKLTIEQAAVLVGMLKATTYYHPKKNPKNALKRRNVVLSQMQKYGHITSIQFDSLAALPLELNYHLEKHDEGLGTYFRGYLSSYLEQWCEANDKDLYADGLIIRTSIDSRIQQYAEQAVSERMQKLQRSFYIHWNGKNPWVDDKDNEIPNFIETIATRTSTYKALKLRFKNDEKRIMEEMNKPKKMSVFSWEGDVDTTFSSMDSLRYYKQFMHAGFIVMNHQNGQILAWVGGIDFKHFKFDHVHQSKRQPGSTFKPFAYCAAIENGYDPCVKIVDEPISIRYKEINKSLCVKTDDPKYKDVDGELKTWSPHNSDWVFSGDTMSLRWAMAKSVNSITSRITDAIGWEKVVEIAHRLGIESHLDTVPSICLGSSDVSLYEMAGAYSTFFNKGIHTEPWFVTRIEDRNGTIIHDFKPNQKRALTEETAFLMQHMLKGGLEEPGGTSQALFQFNLFRGNEFAGKTGTSSNHSDGWFIGATKDIVAASWVGAEERSVHFRTSAMGEGSKTALPIFGMFMEKVYADKSLNLKMGYFPKATVKINKSYYCPTPWRPKNDSTLADSAVVILDSIVE